MDVRGVSQPKISQNNRLHSNFWANFFAELAGKLLYS
jgi:hypothetical protein